MRKYTGLSLLTVFGTLLAPLVPQGPARAQGQQATPAAQQPAAPSGTAKPAAPKTGTTATGKSGQKAGGAKPAPLTLKTPKDKASYAVGMNVGQTLRRDSIDIDTAIFLRALKDALAGRKGLMTEDEARAAFTEARTEAIKKAGEANKKEGETFLAANKVKQGVTTLPSGLQYKILKQGDGPTPTAKDTVVCNYRGTLINDTEFDSSYKRGQPATFQVGGVIKGWTEALQLMAVGSKWQLFIPSDLAYGPPGRGNVIPPNATLVFEVELLSIQPPAPPPAPAPAAPATPPASQTPPAQQTPPAPPKPPQPPSPPPNL